MRKFLVLSIFTLSSMSLHARIIGGTVARDNQGPGIIQISISGEACTATKIGDDVLITAAHCFNRDRNPRSIGFSSKASNPNFTFSDLTVTKLSLHPYYRRGHDLSVIDIAIVHVSPTDEFLRIPQRRLDFGHIQDGTNLEFWGYGCQTTVNHLEGYAPLKKFAQSVSLPESVLYRELGIFNTLIDGIQSDMHQNLILTPGLTMDPTRSSLCFGDSGGPVLKNGRIVGINVKFISSDMNVRGVSVSGHTEINLHTRISQLREWIENEL